MANGLGIHKGSVAAVAGLLALVLGLLLVPVGSADTIAAEGRVTGPGGDPVLAAEACFIPVSGDQGRNCGLSDSEGEYRVSELPQGQYLVEFSYSQLGGENLAPEYWEDALHKSEATPVTYSGTKLTGLDAQLGEGGSFEGRVRSAETGQSLNDVVVCAFSPAEGYQSCNFTEGEGRYKVEGLASVPYKVIFFDSQQGLEPQYFDHKRFASEADELTIPPGLVQIDIDADLRKGATVSGHVYSSGGAPLEEVEVCARTEGGGEVIWECRETEAGGGYELSGLTSGPTKVVFSPDENVESLFPDARFREDGNQSQWWFEKRTFGEAEVLDLTPGETKSDVDGHLGVFIGPPAPPVAPVLSAPILTPPKKTQPLKCKKSQRKVKVTVRGKKVSRCIKKKKHHRHHQHKAGKR